MKMAQKTLAAILTAVMFITPVACMAVYVSNGGVVSYNTPVSSETTKQLWSLKLGTSYRNSPCPPVVINDTVIVMSGKTLYKIDADNGKVLKTADMVDYPSYSYTPVTYADGVIYCPLNNSKIQAFNYKTLKSMWIYTDALGGQSLTPIKADGDCIYTGFWNDEDEYANYVCIDTKDENKSQTDEKKSARWNYKSLGGFYWAGCAFVGNYAVFGTDNGTVYDSSPSKLVCVNKADGTVSDKLSVTGDIRSSVAYNGGSLYFVSKAGYFYSVKLNGSGKFDLQSFTALNLSGASTSTPVIYNSKAYVGVQGSEFSSGYVKSVDIENNRIAYSVKTKGYPQSEVLISDAYLKKTGNLYIYSTYNAAPGGITAIAEKDGNAIAEEIFTPAESEREYCISGIVCDENGTLFYKNDSGNIFAVSDSSVKLSWFSRLISAIINFFKNLF